MLIKNVEEKKRRSWFHSCTGLAEISKSDFFWFPTYIHAYHTLRYDITHKHTQTQMYRHRHTHTHIQSHTQAHKDTQTQTHKDKHSHRGIHMQTHLRMPGSHWLAFPTLTVGTLSLMSNSCLS